MLKNYLKTAFRNLLRYKSHTLINVTGLAIGLTCCLLIYQYVSFEYSFDDFHTNGENIYRVNLTTVHKNGESETSPLLGYGPGPAFLGAVPEIISQTRWHPDYSNAVISRLDNPNLSFDEEHVYYADSTFLEIFNLPLIEGDERAFARPEAILLSESISRKYFGNAPPLGKSLRVNGWISGTFQVAGVFRDVPENSHLQPDFLIPMADLLQKSNYLKNPRNAWGWQNFTCYVLLRKDAVIENVEQKLTDILWQNRREQIQRMDADARIELQSLSDIHLNEKISAPMSVKGSYRVVSFFSIIGLIVLLIALVNYINLTTARSLDRAREIGVRKVIGAQKKQLVNQFLSEALLINIAALLVSIALTESLRPFVNSLSGTELGGLQWTNTSLWSYLIGILSIGTILSGGYPAFILSSFQPVEVLKGKFDRTSGKNRLRRGLVVLQFTISIILLAGTAIVYSQLNFMRNFDIGIDVEQVLTIPAPRVLEEGISRGQSAQRLISEFQKLPGVQQIATSRALPGHGFNWHTAGIHRSTVDPAQGIPGVVCWIDTSFAKLYDLKLIAGSFTNFATSLSDNAPFHVIANETAIKDLGFNSPDESIGQILNFGRSSCRIIGVFEDFNWSSVHTKREVALFAHTSVGNYLSVKINTANILETISKIEATYTSLFPGNPFNYKFVDEVFAEKYRNDERFASLFSIFAGLAILIACMGLLGLAAWATRQRTKEIGVRKVLGASVGSIIGLLSKDFLNLVLFANLFAWPVAWYAMNQWLRNFAFRINIDWWVFAFSGGLALLIALLTVALQAARAAQENPVNSLRYE